MGKFGLILAILALANLTALMAAKMDWWEDASFYHIYPRSFKDSNGDGYGDINGITEKLEYLKEIGVTATWLSPVFKSPMVDMGYDISDFYDIDPLFGTMADFDRLIKKAKKLGIKIILDFVPNHSSEECEWFKKSVNREDGFDDFYVWADGKDDPKNPGKKLPPSNWESVFDGSMWTWNDKREQFYLHQFYPQQPDFNLRNPQVHKVLLDVLKFWLDRGVHGFRIDAVPHMYEKVNDDGTYPDEPVKEDDPTKLKNIYTRDQYETVEILYEWREFLDAYRKEHGGDTRILLAEAFSPINVLDQYFGNGTHFGVHLPFNFNIKDMPTPSDAKVLQTTVDKWMAVMWKNHKMANWVASTHDGARVTYRLGQEKKDLIQILISALPGASVNYYGEEIGMSNIGDDCSECPEFRFYGRSPFQWNDGISAGFSKSNSTWMPVADDYKTVNVKVERGIPRSSLNIYKGIQRLRRTPAFKAFKDAGGFLYGALNQQVFLIVRSTPREEYRILLNMGNQTENVKAVRETPDVKNYIYEYVLATEYSPRNIGDKVDAREITLMPNEGVVLKKKFF
ncbi:maltase A2-like [Eupeodes corollae]|uniref:maltase A2-like n=1 Tax=Eupeodes corollae TaxID=290404 RepID=UPI0024915A9E|nr:maltase A2-like [Eupeodes corollae]